MPLDQLIGTWVAALLKSVAGEEGLLTLAPICAAYEAAATSEVVSVESATT